MASPDPLIRAVHLAARKLAGTGAFDSLIRDVLGLCVEAVGAEGGSLYLYEPSTRSLVFRHVLPESVASRLQGSRIPADHGIAGKVFQTRTAILTSIASDDAASLDLSEATGVPVRTMATVPLSIGDDEPVGVVQVVNKQDGEFTENDLAVLDTVAAVSTMAYVNGLLMEQQSRASSLLGMGKVSHDIGNLAASLYANIAFSEMAMQGLRDQLAESGADETLILYVESLDTMFQDLRQSIDRIVGYSRLISDLSAGKALRPNMQLGSLARTIQTSAAYLETEGRRSHVALVYEIQEDAPATMHDELFVFRIVQNLVGNAIKAVRETIPDEWLERVGEGEEGIFGEVAVRYRFEDKEHWVEVQDAGPGMTRETADRILAGNARSQWDKGSGSGWGMKIVLELAATHGATVTIDSEVGRGTTFRVAFPHRPSP
ncbi:MAG: GAF domain-containing sensor histidine kinase [Fimbriimonadales bacterium]|nr:GAF domain-containing sensor histidine kinase [Fimbriimonadales bacterium]